MLRRISIKANVVRPGVDRFGRIECDTQRRTLVAWPPGAVDTTGIARLTIMRISREGRLCRFSVRHVHTGIVAVARAYFLKEPKRYLEGLRRYPTIRRHDRVTSRKVV